MEYRISRYHDGADLGLIELDEGEMEDYMAAAQQPEGIISLADLANLLLDPRPIETLYVYPETDVWLV